MHDQKKAVFYAILAAALYALNSPLSKLLLNDIPPTMMAGLLYLGAGIGMLIMGGIQKETGHSTRDLSLSRKDLPFTVGMVLLDIAAPIFLMLGLTVTTAANASLLNNFEIVATSIIALVVFKEAVSPRLWCAIACITTAGTLLSLEDVGSLTFSRGSLLILLACVCWGFENNCTRMLSEKDPTQIVVIKGLCSGTGSLIISLVIGERCSSLLWILPALVLGFVAYGLSIWFYIYAQRYLGAARTSAYYAVSPFIGAALSIILLHEKPTLIFLIALIVMIIGTWLATEPSQ